MDVKLPEISARELLLHPMNLLHQMSTALVPGILVFFLLMLKRSPLVGHSTLAIGMLGYKSRIVLLLLIAFIVGRVVQSVTVITLKALLKGVELWKRSRTAEKSSAINREKTVVESASNNASGIPGQLPANEGETFTVDETESIKQVELSPPHENINLADELDPERTASPESTAKRTTNRLLTVEQQTARSFYTSLLMGTVLARDGSAFDSMEAKRANAGLAAASGVVLIIGSCYPGDGLRLQELAGGLFLIAASIIDGQQLNRLKIEAIGNAVGQVIASHSVKENVEILSMAAKVLPVITKNINPEDSEMQSAEMVQEIAEQSTGKTPHAEHKGQPNRRERRRKR